MELNWSAPTQSYEFDTGAIFGCIEPFTHYHGLAGLMHKDAPHNVVRPKKSFLNAEYYSRTGVRARSLPRDISIEQRTLHEQTDDAVVLCFPPEPTYNVAMDLSYHPFDDIIDMKMTLTPEQDVPGFEVFFASYVVEEFGETWAPLCNDDGTEEWVCLDNRRAVNECFGILRDDDALALLNDERHAPKLDASPAWKLEARRFTRPLLVAWNATTKRALIFICQRGITAFIGGQHHGWDTAHDFSFVADLVKGRPVSAHARLIYRAFDDTDQMLNGASELWAAFEEGSRLAP